MLNNIFSWKIMFRKIKEIFSKRPSEINTSTIPIETGSFLDFALRGGGHVTASQAMEFYGNTAAVATSVDDITTPFEQFVPVIQDLQTTKFDPNNEVTKFLKNPNGFETWKEFAGALARHYLLKHDSFIVALGNIKFPPVEIYAAKPQNMSILEDTKDSYPGKYILPSGAGKGSYIRTPKINDATRFFDGNFQELYHIMGFSSRSNNIEGDSPLMAAALEAQQLIKGKTHNLQLLNNGGKLSLIVSFKDTTRISGDEHKERKKRINEDLSGPGNAGTISVISAPDMSIKDVGSSNRDMDYAKLDEMSSQAIYLRYRIPLPLVTVSASTFNNMENAVLQLFDQAVIPLGDTMFAGLSKMLLPRFGIDPDKFRITYNPDEITALRARRLKEIAERVGLNIETKNESREMLPNRKSIGPEGDVIYQSSLLVPVGTDLIKDENEGT